MNDSTTKVARCPQCGSDDLHKANLLMASLAVDTPFDVRWKVSTEASALRRPHFEHFHQGCAECKA